MDCGSNIFERIIDKNLLNNVRQVYVAITHRHPDHIGSLGDLIFYCFYKMGIKVNIYDSDYDIPSLLFFLGVTNDTHELFNGKIPELDLIIDNHYALHTRICIDQNQNVSEYSNGHDEKENVFDCHSYVLQGLNKRIFYSGDCSWIDFYAHRNCDEYFVDCCFADYDGNVHYNVHKLHKDCAENDIDISKVWCMHFDSDEAVECARQLGFNIVEIK